VAFREVVKRGPKLDTTENSRLHDAVIRVCDEAGNVIETHERAGDFKGR
jgi:hypothetical protein